MRVRELPSWLRPWCSGKVACPVPRERVWKLYACAHPPILTHILFLFHVAIPELYPLNKTMMVAFS